MSAKSFTVVRSRWARGGKLGDRELLNSDGNMCCLGFYGLACGIDREDLSGRCYPAYVPNEERYGPLASNCETIANTNDATEAYLADSDREARLTELFAENGIEVTFIDEDPS